MKITLLIATYNWPEALNLCLSSLLKQTVMPSEVVIADDGSREDTRALIDSFREKLSIPLLHVWQEDKGFRKTLILKTPAKIERKPSASPAPALIYVIGPPPVRLRPPARAAPPMPLPALASAVVFTSPRTYIWKPFVALLPCRLSAALCRRSPLRHRHRWRTICTAAERNRFGL